MPDHLGDDMRKTKDDEKKDDNIKVLDEDDIALMKTYGQRPYTKEIKALEDDIIELKKRVDDLTRFKICDTGLAPPIFWDLRGDKRRLKKERPLLVARCTKIINEHSEDPKYLITLMRGDRYVVGIADTVAPTDIEEEMRVGVRRGTYEIELPLSPKVDRLIERMEVEERPDVTYNDIGGYKEEISKLKEVVELPFLYPERFTRLGIEPPKGVLLFGPPGTGKTLCARAVANRTEACFIRVIGTELIKKYAGEVLMATNRPDTLDPALMRPGRIDRKIEFGLPDLEGRRRIFNIHTRSMSIATDIRFEMLARQCQNSTGAEIHSICTEAGMLAIRERRRIATEKDFLEAVKKVMKAYAKFSATSRYLTYN